MIEQEEEEEDESLFIDDGRNVPAIEFFRRSPFEYSILSRTLHTLTINIKEKVRRRKKRTNERKKKSRKKTNPPKTEIKIKQERKKEKRKQKMDGLRVRPAFRSGTKS